MNSPFKRKPSDLDDALKTAYECLTFAEIDSEEYKKIRDHIVVLEGIKKPKGLQRLSPDAVFAGIISLASVVIIVSYEHMHVMTSKALDRIPKPKQ